MLAGIFFTWQNAISPGVSRLSDFGFLTAFKSMNAAILNPLFKVFFLLSIILPFIALAVNLTNANRAVLYLIGSSAIIYVIGVFMVTILGNVPLNELLANATLESSSAIELQSLRAQFENSWNNFNLIRVLSATTSFILLIIALKWST